MLVLQFGNHKNTVFIFFVCRFNEIHLPESGILQDRWKGTDKNALKQVNNFAPFRAIWGRFGSLFAVNTETGIRLSPPPVFQQACIMHLANLSVFPTSSESASYIL